MLTQDVVSSCCLTLDELQLRHFAVVVVDQNKMGNIFVKIRKLNSVIINHEIVKLSNRIPLKASTVGTWELFPCRARFPDS